GRRRTSERGGDLGEEPGLDCLQKMDSRFTLEQSTSKLSRLVKVIQILTTPAKRALESPENCSSQLIDKVLEENLQAVCSDIEKSSQLQEDFGDLAHLLLLPNFRQSLMNQKEVSGREKHVEVSIGLLHELHTTLWALSKFSTNSDETGAPKLDPDCLSAPQIKIVSLALQFVVVLGICPYLNPGVGVPVSQRMGPGQILLATVNDYGTEMSHFARVQSLLPPAKLMCDMLHVQSLRDIVINNHLQDLFSLLFQLRFSTKNVQDQLAKSCAQGPGQDIGADEFSHQTKTASINVRAEEKPDCYVYEAISLPDFYLNSAKQPWTLPMVREHCNQYIDQSVRLSSTQHVLKTLMILSGGGKSSTASVPVKTPVWYKRTVAGLLRDVIMVPPGVQHLIALLVAESPSGHEWQKCKAVAQVISQLPTTHHNIQQFYKSVTSQLVAIVQSSSQASSVSMIRAAGATILELSNRQPSLMESMCFAPMFEPLLRISSQNENFLLVEGIVVPESIFTSCVECLHKLFVVGQEPQSPLLLQLRKAIKVLFEILVAFQNGVSPLKTKCVDLIGAYLGQCEPAESVRCILKLVSAENGPYATSMYPPVHSNVCLTFGESGGIQALIQQSGTNSQEQSIDSWTQPVEAMMHILSSTKTDNVIPQLFISLLQKLTSIVKSETAAAVATNFGGIALPPRLMTSVQRSSRLNELREKICLVSLLAAVGEKYGDGVVSNGGHVLEFVKATLERCVQICEACNDEETMLFEWETVSMAMGLLTAVLSGGVEVGDQSQLLDELLPLLTFISESDAADPKVKEMADDLKVAVATKGLVWAELSQMRHSSSRKQECKKDDPSTVKQEIEKKNLIEVLSETNVDDELKKDLEQDYEKRKSETASITESMSPLEQALQELCDPLLPVRGHGLIALARLVEERSPQVESKQDVLLKVFLENLAHTDSYIYLASVNGLAALSDLCPDQIIPSLTSELQAKCTNTTGKVENLKSQGELVLKVAEAVVKATRRLGQMTPKYRDLLLPAILCGCRHKDSLTRASCLSGLAEVCQLLRFALGPVLYEVVTCCCDVISSDPEAEPRKAAAMTFTLILRGLGKDTLLALDSALIDVYRSLKRAVTNDSEEGVRVHAALALEELDTIMREMLFAKPDLSKRISILGLQ
ncbi:transport and Golgi organization protein 6 homolog, partial [Elysia marginata]